MPIHDKIAAIWIFSKIVQKCVLLRRIVQLHKMIDIFFQNLKPKSPDKFRLSKRFLYGSFKMLFSHFRKFDLPNFKITLQKVLWKNNPVLMKFYYLTKRLSCRNVWQHNGERPFESFLNFTHESRFSLLIIISVAFYGDIDIKMVSSCYFFLEFFISNIVGKII